MHSQIPTILAIDLGTTTVKVGLFEINGKLLKIAKREQKLLFPKQGWVEQSLSETYKLVVDCVAEVNTYQREIKAISFSVQRGSIVPLDFEGKSLSNLIVWMDERGLPYVEKIKNEITSSKYYRISGHPINPITGISKILWLYNNEIEIFSQARVIGNQQTAFLRWLGCDEFVIDKSVGSFLFPFNIREKTWSSELANRLNFPLEKLPRLVNGTEIVGFLSKSASEKLGLSSGIPLVPGGGDGQCAGIGSGAIYPGVAMVNIGTSTGIQVCLEKPYFDPEEILNCAAHVLPNEWEMEGHTQASGSVFKWFRDEFFSTVRKKNGIKLKSSYDELIEESRKAPVGSDGLIFIPTFCGSTAPIIDSMARGVLFGLSLQHSRAHVIRSLLEGISLEIRWMLDSIEKIGITIDEVRLVGGGASNQFWNQISTDIFQRNVSTVSNSEASLTGAAICGATAIGAFPNLKEASLAFVHLSGELLPNSENKKEYDASYKHYQEIFSSLSQQNLFRRK